MLKPRYKVNINGEDVWMQGKAGLYYQVFPWRNEDKTLNWKNILLGGGWGSLFKLGLVLLVIFVGVYGYVHDTAKCVEIQRDPWSYCMNVSSVFIPTGDKPYNLNLSNFSKQQNFYT
jgi:hypothetical protein